MAHFSEVKGEELTIKPYPGPQPRQRFFLLTSSLRTPSLHWDIHPHGYSKAVNKETTAQPSNCLSLELSDFQSSLISMVPRSFECGAHVGVQYLLLIPFPISGMYPPFRLASSPRTGIHAYSSGNCTDFGAAMAILIRTSVAIYRCEYSSITFLLDFSSPHLFHSYSISGMPVSFAHPS